MTFYSDLRDDDAAPLIEEFGQPGTYRAHGADLYDNVSGKTTAGAPTDTGVFLLDLPLKDGDFSEEVTQRSSQKLLLSAREFAAASVTPAVDETVIFGGKSHNINAITKVGPSGEVVIYKMAVQHA